MNTILSPQTPLAHLKENQWYDYPFNEAYCNGVLIKRLNETEVLLAPRWTEQTSANQSIMALEETPGDQDFWYDQLNHDALLAAPDFCDCVWSSLSIDTLVDLWLTLNDARANDEMPSTLSHVLSQTTTSDYRTYIQPHDIETLGYTLITR